MKQLPNEVVKERSRKISQLVDETAIKQNKKWLGWRGLALVSEFNKDKGNFIGRNFAYKPIVIKDSDGLKLGDAVEVEIADAGRVLFGEVCS